MLSGGDIVVADSGNHRLRLLSKDLNIYAFAGSGLNGFADGGDAGGELASAARMCGTSTPYP
jgi:hypothetical protein